MELRCWDIGYCRQNQPWDPLMIFKQVHACHHRSTLVHLQWSTSERSSHNRTRLIINSPESWMLYTGFTQTRTLKQFHYWMTPATPSAGWVEDISYTSSIFKATHRRTYNNTARRDCIKRKKMVQTCNNTAQRAWWCNTNWSWGAGYRAALSFFAL